MEKLGCLALLGWHGLYLWVTCATFSMEVMVVRLHRHNKKRLLVKMAFIGGLKQHLMVRCKAWRLGMEGSEGDWATQD